MDSTILKHFQSKAPTIEERMAADKALRVKFLRIKQGDYKPSAKRADSVSILEVQGQTRLQELVPIRYARMLTSPFAFLRGGATIMAADLAAGPKRASMRRHACGELRRFCFG